MDRIVNLLDYLKKSVAELPTGSLIQKARLFSGLILMTYAFMHFLNHALGHWSLEAMEAALVWQSFLWQSYLGTTLLYGSLGTHVCLVLFKIASLRTFRLPLWQWLQIITGVSIPYLLASHISYTRMVEVQIGIEMDYSQELAQLWPGAVEQQTFLLFVVWLHGCIGIHFWLRGSLRYQRILPFLAGLAALTPAMAATGWIVAARRQADIINAALADTSNAIYTAEDREAAEYRQSAVEFVFDTMRPYADQSQMAVLATGWAVLLVIVFRFLRSRLQQRVSVTYGDGTIVSALPGMTLLEVSQSAGIPHMSVCGGRARCSTCRTLVEGQHNAISSPNEAEQSLLSRLNAPTNVRLACQATIRSAVQIRPLIQPEIQSAVVRNTDPLGWGVERNIAVFFLDIRGFSRISEKSLPYDVVFILNSFFAEVASEIEKHNGYVDKFMGDGLMAIFGLESEPEVASRDALKAAVAAAQASERVSRMLTQHIEQPIKIGIGIHAGNAVVGRIGKTADQSGPSRLTAIGDTVNIAARLESATKEFSTPIVVSSAIVEWSEAQIPEEHSQKAEITVHNITTPIEVVAIREPDKINFSS